MFEFVFFSESGEGVEVEVWEGSTDEDVFEEDTAEILAAWRSKFWLF
jgi:hypothetical protein